MSDDTRLLLAATGVHPERAQALLADNGAAGALRLLARSGSPRVKEVIDGGVDPVKRRLRALGVAALHRGGSGYPATLAGLPDAPDVLFVRGSIPSRPAVAIIGTRRCTAYGAGLAHAMGGAVAAAGWVTVSGLARGIDIAAHRGTLDGEGLGVAVLGSGPDVWYPREHRADGLALTNRGAVVTEFPPGTPPAPWRFPVRNRVISGLSEAVVVVEAGVTGGALITARLALEQGRAVFALPGDVDRAASAGTNLLIRDGAHPVLGAADLVAELELVLGKPPQQPVQPGGAPLVAELGEGGSTADSVAQRLGVPVAEVLADLARLEASGTVRRHGDRYVWTRGAAPERA